MHLRMKRLYGKKPKENVRHHVDKLRDGLAGSLSPTVRLIHKRLGVELKPNGVYSRNDLITISGMVGAVSHHFPDDKPFIDKVARYMAIQADLVELHRDDYSDLVTESRTLLNDILYVARTTKPDIII